MADSDSPSDAPARHQGEDAPSIIESIAARTGRSARVHLPDEDDAAPLIDASSAATRRLPQGRGHYQNMGEIARGGMGVVLKSHDTDLGRDVAMKVLREDHAEDDAILQRFVEEAQIGGQLQHPGIVPVYELGMMDDERPYFTMKLVKGRTLAKLLAGRADPGDERHRFLAIFEKVCETMAYAHARNVLHRDLKPANIMVGAFGEVQVVDWGLAKVLSEGGVSDERLARDRQETAVSLIATVRSSGSSVGSESLAGSVMGTPAYMPPEQAQGQVELLDERADVFSLGAILCEILTGRPPYVGEHDSIVIEAAKALQEGARARLADCGAEPELVDLALDCLNPARATRPADAGALLERIQTHLSSQAERTRQAEVTAATAEERARQEGKRRRLTLGFAAIIVAALTAGGWGVLSVQQQDAERRAQTDREVSSLVEQAGVLRDAGDFEGALDACARAEAVLAAVTPDAELSARVQRATERIEAAAEGRRLQEARADRIAAFARDLEQHVYDPSFVVNSERVLERRLQRFDSIFASMDLDPLGADEETTLAACRALGVDSIIVQGLDEWARVRRLVQGWRHPDARRLSELASRLDDDPLRDQIREAATRDDADALRRVLADLGQVELPPQTVTLLYLTVESMGLANQVEPFLRDCVTRHPGNTGLNMLLGEHLIRLPAPDLHEVLRYYTAAWAASPRNAQAAVRVEDILQQLGRPDEALAVHFAAFRNNPGAEWLLSGADFDAALAPYGPDRRHELARQAAELYLAAGPLDAERRNGVAWSLGASSDEARRHPAWAIELLEGHIDEGDATQAADWNTLGLAYYLAGRLDDAIAAIETVIRLNGDADDLDTAVVALALDGLGQPDQARVWARRSQQLRPGPTEQNRISGEYDFIWEELDARFPPER